MSILRELSDDPHVIVCQGPSVCEGKPESEMPCTWCQIITCHPDGTETIEEPAQA